MKRWTIQNDFIMCTAGTESGFAETTGELLQIAESLATKIGKSATRGERFKAGAFFARLIARTEREPAC